MSLDLVSKYKFLRYKCDSANFIFSTAFGDLNFNKGTEEGIENINNIKNWFNVNSVGYCNQIHSSKVLSFDSEVKDGDALITDKKGIAIGIFTADCVPVLMFDKRLNIIASVHSGWKGTLSNICANTIGKMEDKYLSNPKDIVVYIGPHNRSCCYEVSEEMINIFKDKFAGVDVSEGRYLNLENCILHELQNKGVKKENINCINYCTHCSKEIPFYSYRNPETKQGRMFSFIYMK